MKTIVLGAGGGLGRNVLNAAVRAGHEVRAFVRQVRGDSLPANVQVVVGDATRQEDVTAALRGVEVAYFCLNPRLTRWAEDFPPLLATALVAARETAPGWFSRPTSGSMGPASRASASRKRAPLRRPRSAVGSAPAWSKRSVNPVVASASSASRSITVPTS